MSCRFPGKRNLASVSAHSRWPLAALAAGALITGLTAVPAAAAQSAAAAKPAAEQTSAACSSIYFVSARGSGQPYKGATDMTVSPQTDAVLNDLKKDLPKGTTVISHQLSYPAPSVSDLGKNVTSLNPLTDWDRLTHVNLPAYVSKEEQGEAELVGYLAKIYDDCYSTEVEPLVVLAGYSQGSMVVHNILNEEAADSDGDLQLIAGAVLIADPERMPRSDVKNFGTAPIGDYGLCHAGDVLFLPHTESCLAAGKTTDVAKGVSASTYQICDTGDMVCDTSRAFGLNSHAIPILNYLKFKQDINTSKIIHTTHYEGSSSEVAAAARAVAQNIIRDDG